MVKQTAVNNRKEFGKIIREIAYRHHLWRVFSDFCEMAAIAISNGVAFDQAQEDRYMQLINEYTESERMGFPKLFGLTVDALEDLSCDFLREMFMGLELGSHWHGQFFTPFHVCLMMAKLTIDDTVKQKIEQRGFITVQEPACGAGALILGFAAAMREAGLNYQTQLHVTAIDSDQLAANMCYIQLALHHIPAAIYTGNTLSMKIESVRYTPAHYLGLWQYRFENNADTAAAATEPEEQKPVRADILLPGGSQFGLFELKEAA
jgi:hypothetical protein